ncbi:MAG TPA: nuclear transport factor 2 family protein [Candidatus Obscuribacterales bacterium]
MKSVRLLVPCLLSGVLVAGTAALANTAKSPFANAEENPTTVTKAGTCEVRCIDPHACCEESAQVVQILQKLVAAYSLGDIKTYEKYLDDNCSMFMEGTKQLISGKAKVIDHLKQSFIDHAPGGKDPLVSFTIDQPFAKVTNDSCVVTFFATKEIGGAHPHKERAHITDVFVKRDNNWKKLHWSGNWETTEN